MSNGGVFQIITNDGKQDRMLMATALLNRRLALIEDARSKDPTVSDPTPTLLDIEKTHVLFMNASFKPFAAIGYEYQKVSSQSGSLSLGSSNITFSLPTYGDFISDMCVHATVTAPTFAKGGNTIVPSGRWCAYPGLRLLQRVEFAVSGNPLDAYTQDSALMFNCFNVSRDSRAAFDRCVGQQIPMDGYLAQKDLTADGLAISTNAPSHQAKVDVTNGYQTWKPSGSVSNLDIYIPLLFWFNRDPRLAVPSVALPHANRYINVNLASQAQMFDLNGNGNAAAPAFSVSASVSVLELWVNNIFVNPEVHDIFIKRIGFSLIRVHREHVQQVTQGSGRVLLSNLKWPIECMFVGFRRTYYEAPRDTPTVYNGDKWHKFAHLNATSSFGLAGAASVGAGPAFSAVAPVISAYNWMRMINTLTISAHGVPLYNAMAGMFLDSYVPYRYSSTGVSTTEDVGPMLINFCLFPGSYQPSGHINVSRAREFYLEYTTAQDESSVDIIGSGALAATGATSATLVVIASAINFLLISDGSAVLRYTT